MGCDLVLQLLCGPGGDVGLLLLANGQLLQWGPRRSAAAAAASPQQQNQRQTALALTQVHSLHIPAAAAAAAVAAGILGHLFLSCCRSGCFAVASAAAAAAAAAAAGTAAAAAAAGTAGTAAAFLCLLLQAHQQQEEEMPLPLPACPFLNLFNMFDLIHMISGPRISRGSYRLGHCFGLSSPRPPLRRHRSVRCLRHLQQRHPS